MYNGNVIKTIVTMYFGKHKKYPNFVKIPKRLTTYRKKYLRLWLLWDRSVHHYNIFLQVKRLQLGNLEFESDKIIVLSSFFRLA